MASQTITGPGIQYTQDNLRCFAYSGFLSTSTATQTLLSFQTDSGYILATVNPIGPIEYADPAGGRKANYQMNFNGVGVWLAHTDPQHSGTASTRSPPADIIIPPFTVVTITVDCSDTDADTKVGIILTGRVYEHLPVRN